MMTQPTAPPPRRFHWLFALLVWAGFWTVVASASTLIGVGATMIQVEASDPAERAREYERKRAELDEREKQHESFTLLLAAVGGGLAGLLGSRRAAVSHWLPLAWSVGIGLFWIIFATDPQARMGAPAVPALTAGLVTGTMIGLFMIAVRPRSH